MIQMPTVRPVPWTANSGGVQAVSAVRPVQPAVTGRQDTTDPAAREQRDAAVGGTSNANNGQAVQVGQTAQADQVANRRVNGGDNAQPLDLARERELQREQARQIEEQADRDREAMERLREVLTNVWEASAAVVEQALGENDEASLTRDTSPDLGALSAMQRTRRPMTASPASAGQVAPQGAGTPVPTDPWAPEASANATDASAPGALTGYDERGQGNLDRPEAGSIISQRV